MQEMFNLINSLASFSLFIISLSLTLTHAPLSALFKTLDKEVVWVKYHCWNERLSVH